MSVENIPALLPKPTDGPFAAIGRRQRERDEQEQMEFLHKAADTMFQDMDQQETQKARK